MLPPQSRLRRSDDVGRVRQQGRRWQNPLIVLYVYTQPQKSPASRFAFAVGRHIGKAAQRNRVKRRLREIVRLRLDQIAPGYDCLLIARKAAAAASYDELEEAVVQLLPRGGLMVEKLAESGSGGSPA